MKCEKNIGETYISLQCTEQSLEVQVEHQINCKHPNSSQIPSLPSNPRTEKMSIPNTLWKLLPSTTKKNTELSPETIRTGVPPLLAKHGVCVQEEQVELSHCLAAVCGNFLRGRMHLFGY